MHPSRSACWARPATWVRNCCGYGTAIRATPAENIVVYLVPQGAALDRIAALNPALVVPGHQQPANGTTPASIAFTKEYLAAFDQSLAGATTPEQLQARIKAKYPDLALDIVLRIGSEAALARR